MRFAQWGENKFHRWLARGFAQPSTGAGIGNDAAILPVGRGRVAVTTDAVVEGVHFRRHWFSWAETGRRAAYACLSDLAAVCARPLAIFLTLGIPEEMSAEAVRSFTTAVGAAASEFGAYLAGGDMTESQVFFADLVAVGEPRGGWLRSGACPGDVLAVTGVLGAPAAACALLETGVSLSPKWASLRQRLVNPRPRIAEALALSAIPVHACIDISDGLLLDASRMANASGVRVILNAYLIPVAADVDRACHVIGCSPLDLAAGGGEEYELLVSLPSEALHSATRILSRLGCPITAVGHVERGTGTLLVDRDGRSVSIRSRGWEHYGGDADDATKRSRAR